MEDLVTKITRVIPREDGSEVKIVAQQYDACLHPSVGVDVFRRPCPNHPWELCNDRPHPNWRAMSVDDYNKHGRSEKFQAATHGEILSVVSLIGTPVNSLSPDIQVQ